ncbi:hypothetical protein LCGC14_2802420 [marine sediment metagenome]|uniref:Uncharacterized protein n=1 Tax=marine sediment metagenome TaxID=412755 RepID=A0A0F8YMD1_9ZZZZ
MPKVKPMIGKLINIDLWLARNASGVYNLYESAPRFDKNNGWWNPDGGMEIYFEEIGKRVFSGLKPGECCRVRMQRME